MSEEYDIVIAGAGHNSLICGAYLRKAGLRVQVLEAREVIGGNTITEELTVPDFFTTRVRVPTRFSRSVRRCATTSSSSTATASSICGPTRW
jgi:flavin-dependent dehydrogenase